MSAARIDAVLSMLVTSSEHETELLASLVALLSAADLPAHIARVVAQAREVLDGDAIYWLAKPHWSLDHQMPLRAALTVEGAQRVEDLLVRIACGMPV